MSWYLVRPGRRQPNYWLQDKNVGRPLSWRCITNSCIILYTGMIWIANTYTYLFDTIQHDKSTSENRSCLYIFWGEKKIQLYLCTCIPNSTRFFVLFKRRGARSYTHFLTLVSSNAVTVQVARWSFVSRSWDLGLISIFIPSPAQVWVCLFACSRY